MKDQTRKSILATFVFALTFTVFYAAQLSTGFAQGTAFTYQGRLNDGGAPASGGYDLAFTLFTTNNSGFAIAGPVTNSAVSVTNGLFTVVIDFGPGVFNGANCWLEIGVRTNGNGAFATLTPRQAVTPTPYAIFAEGASNLVGVVPGGGLSGSYSSAVTLNNAANNFNGSFSGNGANVTNVNATTLGGLNTANFWQLGGNNVSAGQFIGSTNNQAVELRAYGKRVLRLDPGVSGEGAPNVVLGSSVNFVSNGVTGATISGGGTTNYYGQSYSNNVTADFGTVGGGYQNASAGLFTTVGGGAMNTSSNYGATISGGANNSSLGYYATVSGGYHNTASGGNSTVSGGYQNQAVDTDTTVGGGYGNYAGPGTGSASGARATVGGGYGNQALGAYSWVGGGDINIANGAYGAVGGGEENFAYGAHATVGGGFLNWATNLFATIPGGSNNIAGQPFTFAAGNNARAMHLGSFVWADTQSALFSSTTTNQFNIRAGGGVRFVTGGAGMTLDGQNVLTGINSTNISADSIVGGLTTNIIVNVPSGTQTLFFTNGILRAVQ